MRRVSVFSTAIVVSGALVSAALATHPQGDVARLVPFACVVSLVWLVATWAVAGPLVAVVVGGVVVAVGSLTVAVYVVGFEPIPFAECGVLAEELSDAACRAHASTGITAAALATAIGSVLVARRISRQPRSSG